MTISTRLGWFRSEWPEERLGASGEDRLVQQLCTQKSSIKSKLGWIEGENSNCTGLTSHSLDVSPCKLGFCFAYTTIATKATTAKVLPALEMNAKQSVNVRLDLGSVLRCYLLPTGFPSTSLPLLSELKPPTLLSRIGMGVKKGAYTY